MRPEVKSKYLAALRSGQQTKGAFRRESGCYCAIGLLLELVAQPEWALMAYTDDSNDRILAPRDLSIGVVFEEVGVTRRQRVDLVDKNDADGYSFAQIADWVEANW